MFTGRGWSYSGSRRRRYRGAFRAQRRRPLWLWLAPPLMLVALIGGALLASRATPAFDAVAAAPTSVPATSTPLAEALLPLPAPTLAPTATLMPTPTVAPTAVPLQPLLPAHRIVAFYGNPLAKQMGILGEIPADQMLSRLKVQVGDYAAKDASRPIVPALELVTPAAQGWPGEDGLYRARMKPEVIDQVAGWAEANNGLLILDVQVGLSSVPEEVDALMPYLRRPYVHLALDPEFAISDGKHIPGEVIGSLDASTIDGVVHTLSDLVASEHLPPKILIVHRFTDSMVTNAWEIAPNPNVQVVVTMDGFGSPALKLAQYRSYVKDQAVEYSGIKLFYHHDVPLLTPSQVLGLDPAPDLVIYQ